ncbi:MAG: ferritin-like domain-containing protein [Armatimonadota bacterium]
MNTNRNEILSTITLAAGLLLTGTAARQAGAQTSAPTDIDVLNFALNLEYLEAEFYSYAVNGTGIDASLTGGAGTAGATTGGAKVAFADANVAAIAAEIAQDELTHVRFLRSALGGQAVAKPAINLAALGIGFANETEFLTVSRALEDVGVSAYAGGARFIQNRDLFEAAGRILGTEAFHAGNIRHLLLRRGITSVPAVDAKDILPTTNKQFATDPTTGLAVARTPAEVLAIVRGANAAGGAFFPAGLNGNVR